MAPRGSCFATDSRAPGRNRAHGGHAQYALSATYKGAKGAFTAEDARVLEGCGTATANYELDREGRKGR